MTIPQMKCPEILPVFPLTGVMMLPGTVLPLHIFEPRYRQMIAEALPAERMLGIVLLKPGWREDYFGSPDTYTVGCAGTMEDVVRLPDGRYTLRLAGCQKIEIGRYVRTEPYRIAEVRPLDEREPDEADQEVQTEKVRLLAAYTSLLTAEAGRAATPFTLDTALAFPLLVNLACMHLGIEIDEKQRLLELHDVAERGRRIIARLEDALERRLRRQWMRGGGRDEPVN